MRLFPRSGLTQANIRYEFAGIRPLPFSPGKASSSITRRHILHDHAHEGAAGLISVIGGKLTTAASLAREVVRKLGVDIPEPVNVFASPTAEEDVESSVKQWARLVACKAKIPAGCAEAIAEWHGRHALAIAHAASLDERLREPLCSHSCHLVAEAVEAVAHESAVTLGDILLRRVPVALGACWSEECSREAAHKIGKRARLGPVPRLHGALAAGRRARSVPASPARPNHAGQAGLRRPAIALAHGNCVSRNYRNCSPLEARRTRMVHCTVSCALTLACAKPATPLTIIE